MKPAAATMWLLLLFLTTVLAIPPQALIQTVEVPVDVVDEKIHVSDWKKHQYKPNWGSLDQRPLPKWYDDSKFGIFIHWGVYSVPSFNSEWFWTDWKSQPSPNPKAQSEINNYMSANFKPGFSYQDFAKDFTCEFFNATLWADIVESSGARYVLLTSKHHEGYALWPSKYSYSWNAKDVGPHRDLIQELKDAIVKKANVKFGLYHSLYEWFHPLYLADKANNYTTQHFVNNKVYPEMLELIHKYQPAVLWSDGEWEAPSKYWKSEKFLAWLYNESPVKNKVVVNDRWGHDTLCKHGGTFTCHDRYNPGKAQQHKWENVMTIDRNTWGFNRVSKLEDYFTTQELIDELVSTVSCGGNIVMNVGPTKEGTIAPIFQDRLKSVGQWLKANGEAIYGSITWDNCQNDTVTPNVWYTVDKTGVNLYAITLRWPTTGTLDLGCPEMTDKSVVTMLGAPNLKIKTVYENNMLRVKLPDYINAATPWGSVFKITNFKKL